MGSADNRSGAVGTDFDFQRISFWDADFSLHKYDKKVA